MLCSICIYSATVASIMKQHQLWYITLVSIIINNAYHHNHNLKDKFCSAHWQILLCHVILSECCGFVQRTIDVISNMVLKIKSHIEHSWNCHLSGFDCTWLGSYQLFEPWVEQISVICWKCQSNICIKKKLLIELELITRWSSFTCTLTCASLNFKSICFIL